MEPILGDCSTLSRFKFGPCVVRRRDGSLETAKNWRPISSSMSPGLGEEGGCKLLLQSRRGPSWLGFSKASASSVARAL